MNISRESSALYVERVLFEMERKIKTENKEEKLALFLQNATSVKSLDTYRLAAWNVTFVTTKIFTLS